MTAIKRERCPKCAAQGKDTSADNLAVYSDGHAHCFACNYHKPPALLLTSVKKKLEEKPKESNFSNVDANFPSDYTPLYLIEKPETNPGYLWLRSFGVTDAEISSQNIGWSTLFEMLVFPIYDEPRNLIAWQGRNFNTRAYNYKKYLNSGEFSDLLHILGSSTKEASENTIILVEDVVSAIKVSRVCQAMPLWGSTVAMKTVRRLQDRFSSLGIWLDRDKYKEAFRAAIRASQFMPSFVIESENDPKCYGEQFIAQKIRVAREEAIYGSMLPEENKSNVIVLPGTQPTPEELICGQFSYRDLSHVYPHLFSKLTFKEYCEKRWRYPGRTANPINESRWISQKTQEPVPQESYVNWCRRNNYPHNHMSYLLFVNTVTQFFENEKKKPLDTIV